MPPMSVVTFGFPFKCPMWALGTLVPGEEADNGYSFAPRCRGGGSEL